MTYKEKLEKLRIEIQGIVIRKLNLFRYDMCDISEEAKKLSNEILEAISEPMQEASTEDDVCKFCEQKNTCVDPCCVKLVEVQEPVIDDLEEEINSYLSTRDSSTENQVDYCKKLARHFANWQLEQILFNGKQYQTLPLETLDRLYANEKKLELLVDEIRKRWADSIGKQGYCSNFGEKAYCSGMVDALDGLIRILEKK